MSEFLKTPFASEIGEGARYLKRRYGQVDQDTFDLTHIMGIIMFQFVDRNMKVSNERKTERKDKVITTKLRIELWREIDQDKKLSKRLMESIPKARQSSHVPGISFMHKAADTKENHSNNQFIL